MQEDYTNEVGCDVVCSECNPEMGTASLTIENEVKECKCGSTVCNCKISKKSQCWSSDTENKTDNSDEECYYCKAPIKGDAKFFNFLDRPLCKVCYRIFHTPIKSKDLPGRNEKCPCGSGKKFKKCCIDKSEYQPDNLI